MPIHTRPQIHRLYLAADTVCTAAASVRVDTGLAFAGLAGAAYGFRAVCYFVAGTGANGSRWAMTGPAVSRVHGRCDVSESSSLVVTGAFFDWDQPVLTGNSMIVGGMVVIEGTCVLNASGDVKVRFGRELTSSTITCFADSHLEWWRIR